MNDVVRRFAVPALTALLVVALAVSPAPLYADQRDDAALGRSVYDDLVAKGQIVDDSRYLVVLRRVGAKIAQAAQPHWFTERFYIVRGNQIDAFAAPGGYVFVDEALLQKLKNVDELANVLGHETAHLVLGDVQAKPQHAERRKGIVARLESLVGKKAARGTPNTFDTATSAGDYTFLDFTRQQEYAADALGATLAAKSGYNPWGSVWFLERLAGDAGYEQYVRQHPSTSDRIGKLAVFLHDNAAQYQRWQNVPPPTARL